MSNVVELFPKRTICKDTLLKAAGEIMMADIDDQATLQLAKETYQKLLQLSRKLPPPEGQ
jgi:hypothetical protein